MARILTCGFETGHIDELPGIGQTSGGGSTAPAVSTTNPRSGTYSMYCDAVVSNGTGASYRRVTLPSALSEIYGRVAVRANLDLAPNRSIAFLRWFDSAVGAQLYLLLNTATMQLQLYRGATFSGTLLATSSVNFLATDMNLLEYRLVVANADSGVFQLKVNGSLGIDYSGVGADTQNTANSNVQTIDFGPVSSTTHGGDWYFDDLAINDTSGTAQTSWCGDAAVLLLKPSGAGTTTQLTPSAGSNYACVDEVPPSTTDYVASSTQDQYDTYALENVPSPYNAVNLVQPIAYAALVAAGTGALKLVLRSGGTDYDDSSDKSLGTTYQFIRGDLRYVDPADSNSWTTTKVNALEAGPKVR